MMVYYFITCSVGVVEVVEGIVQSGRELKDISESIGPGLTKSGHG